MVSCTSKHSIPVEGKRLKHILLWSSAKKLYPQSQKREVTYWPFGAFSIPQIQTIVATAAVGTISVLR